MEQKNEASNEAFNDSIDDFPYTPNAKSFNDSEGHSRDLMRCARRPQTLPPCHIHAAKICSIAFAPPHSRRLIHAVLMQQHSRPHLCSSIDAAALKLQCPNHTYSAALTQQHLCCSSHAASFCRSIHAAACTEQHLWSRSHTPAFTQQHLCCSICAAAFFRRSHAAALMLSLSLCRIYAAEFTPLHTRRHFYATACTLQHSRRSHAAALVP